MPAESPTKSGHRVYFLLIEDEARLLQATMFRDVYKRYGSVLHREGAFILEELVEQTEEKGFTFLVSRVGSLSGALVGVRVPEPKREVLEGVLLLLVSGGKMSVARAGEILGLGSRHAAIRWYTGNGLPYPDFTDEGLADDLNYASS